MVKANHTCYLPVATLVLPLANALRIVALAALYLPIFGLGMTAAMLITLYTM